MEINLKNKEKFFAQYYGQTIQVDVDLEGCKYPLTIGNIAFEPEKCHLTLKPLSSITEEEHREILENPIYNTEVSVQKDKIGNYYTSDIAITDLLRSKGYALPWMGISIEKLVEYGWIKLV